jgi:hypothetical protein
LLVGTFLVTAVAPEPGIEPDACWSSRVIPRGIEGKRLDVLLNGEVGPSPNIRLSDLVRVTMPE